VKKEELIPKVIEGILKAAIIALHSEMCPECKKKVEEILTHAAETQKEIRGCQESAPSVNAGAG